MVYYTSILVLVWISLSILGILVYENGRFSKEKKIIMYSTYLLVGLAALAEWLGVKLNGNPNISPWLIKTVKFFDYVLTPLAGGAIILQFETKNIWRKVLFGILIVNTLFQIVSIFTGWMVVIDDLNQYSHGPAYFVYIICYILITLLVILEFGIFGRKFHKQNRLSLYATLLFLVVGITLQEVLGREVRTAYISLTIALLLLFIHNSEFALLRSDEHIKQQNIMITIDCLTGIENRYAYNEALKELATLSSLPEDLIVFSIDINGLKMVNDSIGHSAGDELIRGASDCINKVFSSVGRCFRTGGDEFIVLANTTKDKINELVDKIEEMTKEWHGKEVKSLSLAVGSACAKDNPDVTIEKLVSIADVEMYNDKDDYYEKSGFSRRLF